MSDDDNQTIVPPSFIALFMLPGRWQNKPSEPRHVIAERYEFCEDLAHLLVDEACTRLWDPNIGQDGILERIHQGLTGPPSALDAAQAQWVVTRLAELLNWQPMPFAARDA